MTVWQLVERLIWIIEAYIIILKMDVLWQIVRLLMEIRDDLTRIIKECRDVTDQYRTGRSAYLRLGQLFMRLFAGLL